MGIAASEVTATIVGARHPFQIEETVAAAESMLSKEDTATIDLLLNKRQQALNLS